MYRGKLGRIAIIFLTIYLLNVLIMPAEYICGRPGEDNQSTAIAVYLPDASSTQGDACRENKRRVSELLGHTGLNLSALISSGDSASAAYYRHVPSVSDIRRTLSLLLLSYFNGSKYKIAGYFLYA